MGQPKAPEHRRKLAAHLARVRFDRTGTPLPLATRLALSRARRGDIHTRFWLSLSRPAVDACWEWQKYRMKSGYGVAAIGSRVDGTKRTVLAHRLAWELTHGPTNLDVLHRCDNPPCCNPAHLFVGTHDDNMADMMAKGRKPGKLTPVAVRDIRHLAAHAVPQRALASRFDVSETTISGTVKRRRWKSVN